jgi:hypothetical protein
VGLRRPQSSSRRCLSHRSAVPGKGARADDRRTCHDDRDGRTRHDDGNRRHSGATDHDERASLRATADGSPGHKSSDDRGPGHHRSDTSQLGAFAIHGGLPFDSSPVFAHADRYCHNHEQRRTCDRFPCRPSGGRLQRSVEHLHDDAGTRAELQREDPILPVCTGPLCERAGRHRPRRRHGIICASKQHVGRDCDLSRIRDRNLQLETPARSPVWACSRADAA